MGIDGREKRKECCLNHICISGRGNRLGRSAVSESHGAHIERGGKGKRRRREVVVRNPAAVGPPAKMCSGQRRGIEKRWEVIHLNGWGGGVGRLPHCGENRKKRRWLGGTKPKSGRSKM